jgi:hypothetical protein
VTRDLQLMSASLSNSTEPPAIVPDDVSSGTASDCPESFCAGLGQIPPIILTGERLLAAQAMQLLMRLDGDLREARAQWNQDWFRRLMRIRPKVVVRLHRRWAKVDPTPTIPLGGLRRRYHANLARYTKTE